MWIFGVITIEFAALAAVLVAFFFYDARISAWEDRQAAKLKKLLNRRRTVMVRPAPQMTAEEITALVDSI